MGFLDVYTSTMSLLGLSSPWMRLVAGATLGFGTQLVLKPSISYDNRGYAKSFIVDTFFPWWAWVVVPALVFALIL